MQFYKRLTSWLFVMVLVSLAAGLTLKAQPEYSSELTVVAHDSFAVSEAVLQAFEQETGIEVRILRAGDTGAMVNQAILSRRNPLGDVLYGVDNTFLGRALEADLFVPYKSEMLDGVDEAFVLDDEHRVTPINYGDVCLNYDATYFREHDLTLPASLEDLVLPEYRSLLVVQNPATSSPGLAFLMATVDVFGEIDDGYTYLDFWQDLVANDVLVVDSWTDAYYGEFSASSDGNRPLVVSYASSPPAEVYFSESPVVNEEDMPTGSITDPDTCFRQIEFAGILQGTTRLAEAQRFIDFMLSVEFQEDLPLQMFVFPVNRDAVLPEVFTDYAGLPEEVIQLDVETIDRAREEWIEAWITTVLQ